MRLFVITTATMLTLPAVAQEGSRAAIEAPSADAGPAEPSGADDGKSWMVLPGAFYGQETSVGFAVFGSVTFPIRGTGDGTWNSTVSSAVVVTLKKQASLAVWPTLYLGDANDWVLNGSYVVSHFPNRYYGIGPRSDAVFQDYTRRWVLTETSLLRRVTGKLYAGLVDSFSVTGVGDVGRPVRGNDKRPSRWSGQDQLGVDAVPGDDGGVVHGLGLRARFEGRDNDQSTRSGVYLDGRVSGFGPAVGSSAAFVEGAVDLRAFHTVGPDLTLAGQWFTELRHGAVPFTHMSELGGDNVLRGMFEGRFRDHHLTAGQAEVRFPIVWRFRGVGFVGVGQVLRGAGRPPAPRWTAGGGLRYELDAVSRSVIRLDVGSGPDGTGFILNFGEAF